MSSKDTSSSSSKSSGNADSGSSYTVTSSGTNSQVCSIVNPTLVRVLMLHRATAMTLATMASRQATATRTITRMGTGATTTATPMGRPTTTVGAGRRTTRHREDRSRGPLEGGEALGTWPAVAHEQTSVCRALSSRMGCERQLMHSQRLIAYSSLVHLQSVALTQIPAFRCFCE